MSGLSPRTYRPGDLERIYEICLRTGASGGDASPLVEDPRLFGSVWAAPYVILEPEHAFVLSGDDGVAVGYVIGALDAVDFENRCEAEWWPQLRERYPVVLGGQRLDDLLIALIHDRQPPRTDLADRYPSELHIDLLPEAQGQGFGRVLLERFLESLRAAGSPGVHLGVSVGNHRAIEFYRRIGFKELDTDGLSRTFVLGL